MVTGCPRTWSDHDSRKRCEEQQHFRGVFYRIPVMSTDNVIYRNAFCALCNNDAINGTFWNSTQYEWGQDAMLNIPEEIFNRPAYYLRSCAEDTSIKKCPQHSPKDVSRKCNMYYAPVEDNSGLKFKNIYCAVCNGANLSSLTCSQARSEKPQLDIRSRDPNFAAIFKPVKRTATCLAEYDGRCYMKLEVDVKDPSSDTNVDNVLTSLPRSKRYDVEHYLTMICMSLSIACILLKILVFCSYKKSRSFSSKCTLCLAFTLLLTNIAYLVTNCVHLQAGGCVVGGVLVHYGFLSTFCWTCVLSYDICRSITAVKLSSTRDSKLAAYGLFAWGLPLVITAAAFTVDRTLPGTVLSPSYGSPICWIGTFWSLVLYFLVPVAVLLLVCLFFYFKSVAYIRQTSSAAGSAQGELPAKSVEEVRRSKQRNHAVLFVRLAMIMCSPWVFAFVGTFVTSQVVDCIVNVLVGLQGVYLFFAFKDYQYFLSSLQKRGISVNLTKSSGISQQRVSSKKT
ncbi:hypothetical protein V5799_011357 [Amblyomma americanum]|uniref:G-protein coupled receptors family 2 profile 2 domain-containing protein n=1 Tax=Amblyomma americanum TaxID=6943 RepID=A0AAQ4EHJ5_AMBAM